LTLPQLGFFTNRALFGSIILSALLQSIVMTAPALRRVFGIADQATLPWPTILCLSLLPVTIVECVKLVGAARLQQSREPNHA
jgi:hypothetical protein